MGLVYIVRVDSNKFFFFLDGKARVLRKTRDLVLSYFLHFLLLLLLTFLFIFEYSSYSKY
jgi:hypothetical protein